MSIEPYTLLRGANEIFERRLVQQDGITPLPTSALVVCELELWQGGKVVRTLVRGVAPELRHGTDGVSLVFELTTALSASLRKGPLTEVYKLGVARADFLAEPGRRIPKLTVDQIVIA